MLVFFWNSHISFVVCCFWISSNSALPVITSVVAGCIIQLLASSGSLALKTNKKRAFFKFLFKNQCRTLLSLLRKLYWWPGASGKSVIHWPLISQIWLANNWKWAHYAYQPGLTPPTSWTYVLLWNYSSCS